VDQSQEVLTTGQVARICQVAPRTVSKWFDTGQLRGYRIPGSRDRRIPLQQLIRFMRAHGIPLNGLDSGVTRVLIVDDEADLTELIRKSLTDTGRYDVRIAESAFAAGAVTEEFRPHVLLVDLDIAGVEGRTLTRHILTDPDLRHVQLVAVGASLTPADRHGLMQQGFAETLAKPFSIRDLMQVIDQVTSIVT